MTDYPDTLQLSSGAVTAEVLPAWGSKMVSLRTEHDGHEFLYQAPYGPHVPDLSVYAPADAYGFDEMFPGVYPQQYPRAPWQEERIADHGNLWYRPWAHTSDGSTIRLWVKDAVMQWHFSKELRFVDPMTLRTTYRVENRSEHPLFWSYSAHILCSYHEGVELDIPDGTYRRIETFGAPLPETCPSHAPHLIRQDDFPDASGALYVSSDVSQQSCLYRDRYPDKTLQVEWTSPVRFFGIWYNKAGWPDDAPLTHVGLEPATAGHPDLAKWLDATEPAPLLPGTHAEWHLTLKVLTP